MYNSPLPDTAREDEGKLKLVDLCSSPNERRSFTDVGFGGESPKRSMF